MVHGTSKICPVPQRIQLGHSELLIQCIETDYPHRGLLTHLRELSSCQQEHAWCKSKRITSVTDAVKGAEEIQFWVCKNTY